MYFERESNLSVPALWNVHPLFRGDNTLGGWSCVKARVQRRAGNTWGVPYKLWPWSPLALIHGTDIEFLGTETVTTLEGAGGSDDNCLVKRTTVIARALDILQWFCYCAADRLKGISLP